VANNGENKNSAWRSVLIGGIPGIMLGVLGDEAVETAMANDKPAKPDIPDIPVEPAEIKVAESVNDDMSFNEAFAAARAEVGPGGAFVWHGQVYSTFRADDSEWQNMTDEQKTEYSETIISQVHPEPYNDNTNHIHHGYDGGEGSLPPTDDDEDNGEIDVHIVGVGQIIDENGAVADAGYGEIEGVGTFFIDRDGDGEVDTLLIDENGNGMPDDNVVLDVPGSGLTIDAMVAEASINNTVTADDGLYDGMPDYTNDADISNLA